jgi:sialic acid synthase SpsE
VGVNHNGDFEKAKELVENAVFCGADAVKFQTFWNIGLEKYEFTKEQWVELKKLADSLAIEFMSTPHWGSPLTFYKDEDFEVIDFVDSLVKRHKVASPYLTNRKYLEYIASKGKPLLISTGSIKNEKGVATNKEIREALSWIPQADITLLHCVSKYPLDKPNYKRIRELKIFKKPVGVSDHSLNKMIQCFPVVEKHFKLDDDCIDANVSLNPEEFREMVRNIRNYQLLFK